MNMWVMIKELRNLGIEELDARFAMQDARCRMQDARYRILFLRGETGYWVFE